MNFLMRKDWFFVIDLHSLSASQIDNHMWTRSPRSPGPYPSNYSEILKIMNVKAHVLNQLCSCVYEIGARHTGRTNTMRVKLKCFGIGRTHISNCLSNHLYYSYHVSCCAERRRYGFPSHGILQTGRVQCRQGILKESNDLIHDEKELNRKE